MKKNIRVFQSVVKGKKVGTYKAAFELNGKQITWTTGTKDKTEALARAVAERARLQAVSAAPAINTPKAKGIFSQIFSNDAAQAAPPPVVETPQPFPTVPGTPAATPFQPAAAGFDFTTALAQSAPPVAPPPAGVPFANPDAAKIRRVHEVTGKLLTMLTVGGLRRACKFAGREPGEADDDEEELLREGWSEVSAQMFGTSQLSPAGKIVLGSAVAGTMMFMTGKRIPPALIDIAANQMADNMEKQEGSADA